ncbi:MAG TPA: trypsin-like peptidase domain-containing protein [Candidatus Methylomirabilis sp.]|nr:trypsin-like peptidase domain-containing protein [Candidatus Methylomirabilis sp.]
MLLLLLGALAYRALSPLPPALTPQEIDELVAETMAVATPRPAISADVYQLILPSLVLIRTQVENSEERGDVGVGTGVVINASADVLTAMHVVEGAREIQLSFADGSQSSAEIIVAEPENDIAVLHPSQLPELIIPAVLGSPNPLRVGDQIFAVGNPFGLTGSMSAGVISGFDRSFALEDGERRLEGLIQFDAAVNPGNSGGPLLSRDGQVVGIVTALANPSEQGLFIGIGFAVPIGVAGRAAGAPDY